MTAANRLQIAFVRESTLGTTPGSPRMRAGRITSETLEFRPEFVDSEEIRPDRMLGDPIKVMQSSMGGVNGELYFPEDNRWLSDIIRSAMWSTWDNMPSWDNDGTADSVITDAGTAANTYAVVSGGAAAVVGHLVRATGFTNAANNKPTAFRVASSTATTIVGTSLSLAAEVAPPGTARLKVVGFEGASGDITATASGLGSTALNFTTLNLKIGQWINIGGALAGQQFNTAANNSWARISAIAPTALTLDNLPTNWATDAGTGKTIRVFVCDMIRNGVTQTGLTIEKGFLAQNTPTYIVNRGMIVNTLEFTMASRQKVNWAAAFMGMGGSQGTTALDAAIDAAEIGQIMAANASVGRLGEGGAALGSPNWAREFSVNINNNLRQVEALDNQSPVDIREGEFTVTGRLNPYFGSNALLTKFYAGTPTSLNSRIFRSNQAVIFDVPRAVYRGGGNPSASGKNTDVMLPLDYQASLDTTLNAHLIINRAEYAEATS
jgi:hypothetical protein